MRIQNDDEFSNWLLSLGNGSLPTLDEKVALPFFRAMTDKTTFTKEVFGENLDREPIDSAILCSTNTVVNEWNQKFLHRMKGRVRELYGSNEIKEFRDPQYKTLFGRCNDFLKTISCSGVPDSKLFIKKHCICLLMRNLSKSLTKSTKIRVLKIVGRHVLLCQTLDTNEKFWLPRINFEFDLPSLQIVITRKQFPLQLCWAITVNKSQSQSLQHVGFDLRNCVFQHGSLYTGCSRGYHRNATVVLSNSKNIVGNSVYTSNVVIPELLLNQKSSTSS